MSKQKQEEKKAVADAKTVAANAPDAKTKKEAEKTISIVEPKVDKAGIVDKALSQGITCSFCSSNLNENGVKVLTESDKKFKDKPVFILECRKPHTKHDVLQKVVQEASTPSGIIEILVKDL